MPTAVESELGKKGGAKRVPGLKVVGLTRKEKDLSAYVSLKYGLGMGESEAITLCKSRKIKMFFTDDLGARLVAERENIEAHGSVGILLRAFREGILGEEEAIKALDGLAGKSTLFITYPLVEEAIRAVKKYSRQTL
ncbi:MAG: hypothetical protein KAW41_05800 [Candidatus Diapherotrites archaeon]|nr:hypothetical protein [Candidatus Diapherotrites archaeon]